MKIKALSLQTFRIYQSKQFLFDHQVTMFVGPNAVGKTSIIEAVEMLATGDSFRASKIDQMIAFGEELSRVRGVVEFVENGDTEEADLELLLTKGVVQGKKTRKRLYSVNDVRRRKSTFVGKLLAVSFRPEDMRLIEGSKSRRRTYLDTPIKMIDPNYARAIDTYEKALRQRNKLLEQVREGQAPANSLHYWNQTLLKHGMYVQEARRRLISFINTVEFSLPFKAVYQPSVLNEERQQEYQQRAIAAGRTLIGPHKDDLEVHLIDPAVATKTDQAFDLATYGSRGQQRMAVLWLKLAEQAFLKKVTEQQPVLLLDDILSELDPEVRVAVLTTLPEAQIIITSADDAIVPEIEEHCSDVKVFELEKK